MIPSFYKYLQLKLFEHAKQNREIDEVMAFELMKQYRIPKKLKRTVLKEMEDYELIEIHNPYSRRKKGNKEQTSLGVINCEIDLDVLKVYRNKKRNLFIEMASKGG